MKIVSSNLIYTGPLAAPLLASQDRTLSVIIRIKRSRIQFKSANNGLNVDSHIKVNESDRYYNLIFSGLQI